MVDRRRRSPFEDVRELVYARLAQLLDTDRAATALLLPPTAAEDALVTNRRILRAATLPAIERYSGVVYEGLAQARLSEGARAAADREILIFSGLFGVLRGGDPIPAYRVPAKASLPGLGVLATFWRRQLGVLMPPLLGRSERGQGGEQGREQELVIDLRSGDYAAMWQPGRGAAPVRMLSVRVLSTRPGGTLGVISYNSKLAKGKLAAALLERRATGGPVEGPDDIARAWTSVGGKDAVTRVGAGGTGLDLLA